MTARVLVVDDLAPNVKLLEAKLRAEYFDVLTALSGQEAIDIARAEQPDIILLDIMMPGMDGFEACRILKNDRETCHIPVVMVTALDQQADRITGLDAGADDFLTKPVEDIALFARVRSLTRLKMMTDELRMGHAAGEELGLLTTAQLAEFDSEPSEVMVIDDTGDINEEMVRTLPENYNITYYRDVNLALETLREKPSDLIIVNMALGNYDPLRLCSTIRSIKNTRLTPLLAMVRRGDMRVLVRSLEVGVNDYLTRPVDKDEMAARVRTQLRRKHYIDKLRMSYHSGLELAVTDQLTGMFNRRYLATHMETLFADREQSSHPISVLLVDIDHFKSVNDTYGHDVGDQVLKEVAKRMMASVRGVDIACRYGGEEFVFLMPDTNEETAHMVAERLRQLVEATQVIVNDELQLDITVSVGTATVHKGSDDTAQQILKQADEALYTAKEGGRNRVVQQVA
ncbi:MAG: PleD family two-component system response regulator [bacterium]